MDFIRLNCFYNTLNCCECQCYYLLCFHNKVSCCLLKLVSPPRGWGGETPIYGLYRYVPRDRVLFFWQHKLLFNPVIICSFQPRNLVLLTIFNPVLWSIISSLKRASDAIPLWLLRWTMKMVRFQSGAPFCRGFWIKRSVFRKAMENHKKLLFKYSGNHCYDYLDKTRKASTDHHSIGSNEDSWRFRFSVEHYPKIWTIPDLVLPRQGYPGAVEKRIFKMEKTKDQMTKCRRFFLSSHARRKRLDSLVRVNFYDENEFIDQEQTLLD